MPHNQSTNKISAFIGIVLLIAIIAFTVFINIPVEEKEKEFKPFAQNELNDFWKLDSIETTYKGESVIEIHKIIKDKILFDSLKEEQNSNCYFTENENETIYYYGDLAFLSHDNKSKILGFEVWEESTEENRIYLSNIGHFFTKYNISSVSSASTNWTFTVIDLKDGRKIFLLKKGTVIERNEYQELIEQASFINDSTLIILPLTVKKVAEKYSTKEKHKERINLFSF